ncbi:MAG: hypothetical protein ABSC20_06290 [Candidatus Bathyarchaeia archaeon]|jgi:hypothetical protein
MATYLTVNVQPSEIEGHTKFIVYDVIADSILSFNVIANAYILNPDNLTFILYSGQIPPITYTVCSDVFYDSMLFAIQIRSGVAANDFYNVDHFTFTNISDQTHEVSFPVSISACDSNGNVLNGKDGRDDFNAMCGIVSTLITIAGTIPNQRLTDPPFIQFMHGVWTGEVVVHAATSSTHIQCRGGGIPSNSNTFNVS